jgi:hypothetical protein
MGMKEKRRREILKKKIQFICYVILSVCVLLYAVEREYAHDTYTDVLSTVAST